MKWHTKGLSPFPEAISKITMTFYANRFNTSKSISQNTIWTEKRDSWANSIMFVKYDPVPITPHEWVELCWVPYMRCVHLTNALSKSMLHFSTTKCSKPEAHLKHLYFIHVEFKRFSLHSYETVLCKFVTISANTLMLEIHPILIEDVSIDGHLRTCYFKTGAGG